MKRLAIATCTLSILLTAVQPISAQTSAEATGTSSTSLEAEQAPRLRDLGMALNPQLGVSSFEYSKGANTDSESKLSGGLTVEFGGVNRKLETGLLVLQSPSSTYLTIPMNAKLKVVSLNAQSWYAKFGFMPAFEIAKESGAQTNDLDVIGSLGAGGRFEFSKKADFIIEATFNRGIMDALRSAGGDNLNQGFLVLAGMSFNI